MDPTDTNYVQELPHHTVAYKADNKGPMIIAVCLAVTIFSTIFVALRVFTRQKIMGQLHLDDWLVIPSIVFQWVSTAMAIVAVEHGNGRHFDLLTLDQKQGAIFWTILGFPFGLAAFGIPKLAVVALLVRIMNPSHAHKCFLWGLSGLCLGVLFGCVVILYAQCTPASSQWDFSVTEKQCISKMILVYYAIAAGAFSAFTDLYLAIYPAFVLTKLQLNIRKKMALCSALGIGSGATIVAIYKCTRLPTLASDDFSFDTSDLVVWTVVEASTIIIACCIPVLQPLVDLIFGRRTLGGSSYQDYSSSKNHGTHKSGIEMHNGAGAGTSSGRMGGGDSHALASEIDRTGLDSQESILGPDSKGGFDTSASAPPPRHHKPSKSGVGNITRTDVITVSYDDDDQAARPVEANSWVRM
ncbi:hypothetical protein N3K66_005345 [Trichothecium roseum]|uniref:Uncharacterized protein n=1 Tax=Trichothecium roseum TaxID=47278 RepID=A0ACC0UXM3_9HYPO|nr:hypothetical protein N3K66_005345 [Trichothecium roseum]